MELRYVLKLHPANSAEISLLCCDDITFHNTCILDFLNNFFFKKISFRLGHKVLTIYVKGNTLSYVYII